MIRFGLFLFFMMTWSVMGFFYTMLEFCCLPMIVLFKIMTLGKSEMSVSDVLTLKTYRKGFVKNYRWWRYNEPIN